MNYIFVFSLALLCTPHLRGLMAKKKMPKMLATPTLGGELDNPGIQISLNKKGLDYINKTAGNILNTEINKLTVPNFRVNVNNGFVEANNLHITKFVPPSYTYNMLPTERKVQWSINKASMFVSGNWKGEKKMLAKFKGQGSFEASASDVSMTLTVTIGKTLDGKPIITESKCRTIIHKLKLDVHGGLIGFVANLFSSLISNKIKPSLENEICYKARNFIMNDVNAKLKSFSTSVRLERNMVLDMSLCQNPEIQNHRLSTFHFGGASFTGVGVTPFGPHALTAEFTDDRMINIFVSDYVLNSLFYHAHNNQLTEFVIQNKQFLDLECSDSFCLGLMVPSILNKYPGSKVKIVINTIESPFALFSEGVASLTAKAITKIVAVRPNKADVTVISALLDLKANLKIWMHDNNVTGSIKINHLDLNLINSTVPFDFSNDLNSFSDVISPILQDMVNKEFKKGIPMKLTNGVLIVNPSVKIADRTFQIYSDLMYDSFAV